MSKGCSRKIRAFGRDLQAFLNSDEGFEILGPDYETWTAGGCWILAEALHAWIGRASSLWAVWGGRPYRGINHVVTRIGDCFLDGDGASSEEELLRRQREEERLEDAYLRPFRPEEIERRDPEGGSEIECPADIVKNLTAALRRTFGPGRRVVSWVLG